MRGVCWVGGTSWVDCFLEHKIFVACSMLRIVQGFKSIIKTCFFLVS